MPADFGFIVVSNYWYDPRRHLKVRDAFSLDIPIPLQASIGVQGHTAAGWLSEVFTNVGADTNILQFSYVEERYRSWHICRAIPREFPGGFRGIQYFSLPLVLTLFTVSLQYRW
jgi:hypothetical protein